MEKEKQIEEMAKDVCKNVNSKMCADGTCHQTWDCPYNNKMAKILIEKNYQKITENEVVISKAEYNDLKGLEAKFDDYLIKEIKETRKETAGKFMFKVEERLAYYDKYDRIDKDSILEWVGEIAKQFGVKIGEIK